MLSSSEFHRQVKENALHEMIGIHTKSNPRMKVLRFEMEIHGVTPKVKCSYFEVTHILLWKEVL